MAEIKENHPAASDVVLRAPPTDPTKLTQDAVDRASNEWGRELAALREILETRLNGMDTAVKLLAERIERIPPASQEARDHMRKDIDRQVISLRELLEGRIAGMDIATKLLAGNVEKIPSDTDRAVGNLREFIMGQIANSLAETRRVGEVALEKFAAIDGTFSSNALALTAALAAQKEAAAEQNKSNTLAITKSEVATKEKIDSNAAQTQTSITSLADRVDDLKGRMDRGEGKSTGGSEVTLDRRAVEAVATAERTAQAAQVRATLSVIIGSLSVLIALTAFIVLLIKK